MALADVSIGMYLVWGERTGRRRQLRVWKPRNISSKHHSALDPSKHLHDFEEFQSMALAFVRYEEFAFVSAFFTTSTILTFVWQIPLTPTMYLLV